MKTVIEMAREAGLDEWWDSGSEARETFDAHLERLVELVRADAIADEREACAKPDFWEGYIPEPVKPAPMTKDEFMEPLGCVVVRPLVANSTTPQPAKRTWEEWFKWWRTSKVADSTEAEIDFADFMLIVRAVESEYGIKEQK